MTAPVSYPRAIDPDMARVLERMRELSAGQGDRYALPYPAARQRLLADRQWWLEDAPPVASVSEETLSRHPRRVTLRWHVPADANGGAAIVYLHGGGWCVGSNDTHRGIMQHLAQRSGVQVCGVDYSLAPEHPFPAAVEDVRAAVDAVCARLGSSAAAPAPRYVLAGDSAGANLALVEAMRRRDADALQPAGLLLFYGAFGPLRDEGSFEAYGSGEFGLSVAAQRRYLSAYLGEHTSVRNTAAFPLAGDLTRLPSTYIIAAGLDPLLDDSRELHRELVARGTRSRLKVFDGVIHGFLSYTRMLPQARDALASAAAFARATLSIANSIANEREPNDV